MQDCRWHPISVQRALAKRHGFEIVYEHGRKSETIKDFIRQVDDGDTCAVSRLFLLADQEVTPAAKRRKQLLANVRAIYDAGGCIFELDTGKEYATVDALCDTLLQAYEDIANAGRRRKRDSDAMGRPALEFSKKQQGLIVRYWRDTVKYRTNAEALEALEAEHGISISPATAYNKVKEWTGSGRSGR